MPELPEVQTIVSDLQSLVGYKVDQFYCDWPRAMLPSVDYFKKHLPGKEIKAVHRRAKFIIIELSGDFMMAIHLRMSGRLLIKPAKIEPDKHTHVVFFLNKSRSLHFRNPRKFGRVWLAPKKTYLKDMGLEKYGAEPLDPDFTFERFLEVFASKKGCLKAKLLDQTLIAGIGNIYADESCFLAGLHPESKIQNLSKPQLKKLYESILASLKMGIKTRGSSVGEFVDAFGKVGKMRSHHFAYRRAGEPCKVCKTEMEGLRVAQRGTTYCPKCQTEV